MLAKISHNFCSAYGERKPNCSAARSETDSFATACVGEFHYTHLLQHTANADSSLLKEADLGRGNYKTATEQVRIVTRFND
jgi:hypothetical protein